MKELRRRKWIAAVALGAMLGGQMSPALASTSNVDAKFRARVFTKAHPKKSKASSAKRGKGMATPGGLTGDNSSYTATPIKHVILIIGENRSFDHVFATYTPPAGQTVWNLLSEGSVNADGTPGPNMNAAQQWQASDTTTFSPSPSKTAPFTTLPEINTDGAPTAPHFTTPMQAELIEPA